MLMLMAAPTTNRSRVAIRGLMMFETVIHPPNVNSGSAASLVHRAREAVKPGIALAHTMKCAIDSAMRPPVRIAAAGIRLCENGSTATGPRNITSP
jgi:hypothetical protein